MKRPGHRLLPASAATVLALAVAGAVVADEAGDWVPLVLADPVPLDRAAIPLHSGSVRLGLAYTSDDNFVFGQYNGLQEEGATPIGDFYWQDFRSGDSHWQLSLSQLGRDTREGEAIWRLRDRVKLTLGFDSQLQRRNDSGRTPFRGDADLRLAAGWQSGLYTSDWTSLEASLRAFDRELERDRLYARLDARLNERWAIETGVSYEAREGTGEVGAAIYTDAASGDAVLLPAPIDNSVLEFDLGLLFSGERLHLEGRVAWSDFDNEDDLLSWQNPYSSFGDRVAYPAGSGGLGLAPDNEQGSLRLSGQYIFSTAARVQFDYSYAQTRQDQRYSDYSANSALVAEQALPRDDLDGEVATGVYSTRLLLRPLPKLNVEAFVRIRDRDYDVPRDGYRYIRGDGGDQPEAALTVYNTGHDYWNRTTGFELAYRLPLRSRLRFEYAFEEVERENAAVEETEESRSTLGYRIQPWDNFSARLELSWADRVADTYEWAQSYYALLDAELINATPDNQRYITHPALSQFHLSNREQLGTKIDLSYLPADHWSLGFNLQWQEEDYDKSELGLTDTQWWRIHVSASYAPSASLSASLYAGWDQYEHDQTGRAFNGGQEKDAFEIYPPLPQASDPGRNWTIDATDTSLTLGANLKWQPTAKLQLALDYRYVDTTGEQALGNSGGAGLDDSDLPDVDTRLHHLEASGTWQLRENLALRLDYQYYDYHTDDWAWEGVQADTIGKVLTFGERNPDEEIHYVGASVIYRWQ